MSLITRKCGEQQVQLTASIKLPLIFLCRDRCLRKLSLVIVLCLIHSFAEADIYRFVTIDGIETFTDAPGNNNATVIIKDHPLSTAKQHNSSKKQKIHDISLDEIVEKSVSATFLPHKAEQNSVKPHLPLAGGTITSRVGMRIDPIDGVWRHHNGIDIAIPTGTPVRPVAPGVVVYTGSRTGYGNTVVVEHDNGVITLYAHNSRILVAQGQQVAEGSTLALSGSTGRSTGPHLHFEAWQAGINVTTAFLPDSGMTLPQRAVIASSWRVAHFRSKTLSDGSLLFTNLPASTP